MQDSSHFTNRCCMIELDSTKIHSEQYC